MKPRSRRLKRVLTLVLLLIAVQVAGVLVYRAIEEARNAEPTAAPFTYENVTAEPRGLDAKLVAADGSVRTLRDSLGDPLFVHFWATWCEPCRAELPALLEFTGRRKVRVVLVSVDESWEVVRHFFDGKVPAEVVLDREGSARRAFAVSSLPDTFLLDREGRPTARFYGPRRWLRADAHAELDRLLDHKAEVAPAN